MNRSLTRFLLSLAVSVVLLVMVLRRFDFGLTWASVRNANPRGLWEGFGLIALAYGVRGLRWRIWERDLTVADSMKLILIGFMGNNILPARLGEVIRAVCTARKTGSKYGKTAAIASIAIERVLDGFVLSCAGLAGLYLIHVDKGYQYSLLAVSLAFAILTFGLLASIYFHQRMRDLLARIHAAFPGHLTRFGQEKVSFFLDGLLLIKGAGRLLAATAATALIWGIEYYAYFRIALALLPDFDPRVCLLFVVVVNFASLFPFTVGGIGAIESVTTYFLINAGVPAHEALAMVTLQHAFQFGLTTALGGLFYFTDGYFRSAEGEKAKSRPRAAKPTGEVALREAYAHLDHLDAMAADLKLEKRDARVPDLSIVIPGYNEISRLPKTLLQTVTWCARSGLEYEIIYVDDGSRDDTVSVAKLFGNFSHRLRTISCPHAGKGSAVRMGMLNATGAYVLFMDADGATPMEETPKLMAKLKEGAQIAIGSRVAQVPGETKVITSLHRRIIGRTFSAIVNTFAIPGFADTQCGFKMFRQEVVKDIFSRQKLNGFAFDVELLYIAGRLGYRVDEVPVNWENQEGSKVNLVADSMKMLADILRIKWLHRREKWGQAAAPARPPVSPSQAARETA